MMILKRLIYKIILAILGQNVKNSSMYLKYLKFKYRSRKSIKQLNIDWDHNKYNKFELINYLISTMKNDDIKYLEICSQSQNSFDSTELKKKKIINYNDVNNIQFDVYEKYDLIFLDGNHNYLQLRKDAIKSFKLLKKGGWILLHYFIPRTWLEEHVPVLYKGDWVGDCWKFGYELSFMRSINFITVQIDFGICLIPFSESIIDVPDCSRTFDFANKTSNYDFFIRNKNKLNIKSWDDSIKWINQYNHHTNNQIKNHNL